MKFVTVNTTSYNKDAIIGVEMPTRDVTEEGEPTGKWFYIVFIKDAIEEIVEFDNAEDCIKSRTELMTQLENNYYEDIQLETEDVHELTGCMDTKDLLAGLKNLKEQFHLDDTYDLHEDTFTVPLIDQIYNRLNELDGLQGWSERLAKVLIEIEEHLETSQKCNGFLFIDEILKKIRELPLDEYRF